MLWVTKKKIRIARAATCWLIQRFVDKECELLFVDDDEVATIQTSRNAIGFHATGARHAALDERGRVAFQSIADEYLPDNRTLLLMGRIVRDADRAPKDRAAEPEADGLRAITVSFPEACGDDHEIVRLSALLYDSLYHTLSKRKVA